MGAGSKFVTPGDVAAFFESGRVQSGGAVSCKEHWPLINREIGVRKFLNTRRPYCIMQCDRCKREYVQPM